MFSSNTNLIKIDHKRHDLMHPQVERVILLTQRILSGGTVTNKYIMNSFHVSKATATRDLLALEIHLPVMRDNGVLKLLESPNRRAIV